jgi:hypothetical protein
MYSYFSLEIAFESTKRQGIHLCQTDQIIVAAPRDIGDALRNIGLENFRFPRSRRHLLA